MALVVFAEPSERADPQHPQVTLMEPPNWQANYYKRQRNKRRFGVKSAPF